MMSEAIRKDDYAQRDIHRLEQGHQQTDVQNEQNLANVAPTSTPPAQEASETDVFQTKAVNKFVAEPNKERSDKDQETKQLESKQQERLNEELAARIRNEMASRSC